MALFHSQTRRHMINVYYNDIISYIILPYANREDPDQAALAFARAA